MALGHLQRIVYTVDSGPKCHYAHPMQVESPIAQGFSLKIGARSVPLDATGFEEVSFRGEYPIAIVDSPTMRCP